MAYDYAISVGGTAIDTIVDHARFVKYTSGMRRGNNLVIPYKHGEYSVPDKYFERSSVMLEVFLPSGTHDAAAQALSDLALLLSSQSLVAIQQTDPHRGWIRAMAELITDPVETQNQLVYLFGLNIPSGFWEDVTESTATGNPPSVTTTGDRPVDDMTLTFAGVGFLEHTDPLGQVSRVEVDSGAGGTPPYVVDVGAGTIVDSAGTPAAKDEFLTVTQPWWMKFQPDSVQSFTSNVSVTVDWRNKWA